MEDLWMPDYVLFNKQLGDTEKFLLALIISESKNNGYCINANKWFADMLYLSENSISRLIASLKNKKAV